MKILILKPSSLGDVVQAIPVLRLLKQWNAASEIYWWLSADLLELLQPDPDLAGVIPFQRHRWTLPRHWGEMLDSLQQIRAHQFDWVIDLQGLARSSLVAWLAQGRLTVGVEDWREGAPGMYDRVVARPSRLTHAVDWYLEVLRVLDVPIHWDFQWLPPRVGAAQSIQKRWAPAQGRWIIINPGARWLNKRWPVESFRQCVRQLAAAQPDLRFAVLGSRGDAALGSFICQAVPARCLDLTGQTSLSEMIEWIRLSALVITNDTGPMHIAAALDKPIVGIFGPTEPHRTGPYRQIDQALRFPLPCAPCLKPECHLDKPMECLRAIGPEVVCAKVLALLNKRASSHVD